MGNESALDHRVTTLERAQEDCDRLQEKMGENLVNIDKRVMATELNQKNFADRVENMVTRDEFTPIRMIVYGLAASALTGLLSAILAKVFMK